jgi:hypothetical protein
MVSGVGQECDQVTEKAPLLGPVARHRRRMLGSINPFAGPQLRMERTRSLRRLALLLSVIAVAALVPSQAAARGHHGFSFPLFDVPAPAPGHVTLAAYSLKFDRSVRRGLPRRLKLGLAGRQKLPPSLRILTAVRRVRSRGSVRYSLLVLAVNQRTAQAAAGSAAEPSARAADFSPNAGFLLDFGHLVDGLELYSIRCNRCHRAIFFAEDPNPYGSGITDLCDKCMSEGHEMYDDLRGHDENFCPACRKKRGEPHMSAVVAKNVDEGGAIPDSFRGQLVKQGFGAVPAPDLFTPPFGDPNTTADDPHSSTDDFDTGHYDDGHAFGWGVTTPSDAERAIWHSYSAFVNDQLNGYIAQLEQDLAADINGDGALGAGTGQQITTTVGPPTITGGP